VDYLVDTNVLLRFADRMHALHPIIRAAVRKRRSAGDRLQATSQNFAEFWNVATRPVARNGFGLTPEEADRRLRILERLFPILPDSPAVYPEWRRIIVAFGVSGVQVHDARLVAAMKANGITLILTLNPSDFVRYATEGIVAVDPTTV
jgi:predicted nucleic acid-binding protein